MTEQELIVGVRNLTAFYKERGLQVSYGTLSKLCSPKIDRGPEREGFFGSMPVFLPEKALAWYYRRITPTRSLLGEKRRPKTDEERARDKERRGKRGMRGTAS